MVGIRVAPRTLPGLSRRRLLALAIGVTGVALLLTGLVPDPTTVLLLALLAGLAGGVSANAGHLLVEQEAEETQRARTAEHLRAVAGAALGVAAICAPLLAAAIGPHRIDNGRFTFDHAGAAYTLMLVGALLLPIAALVLGKTDDRSGVPLRRDLREALRGAEPAAAPAPTGFFIAVEGGDGAGKSTQVEALASWIRAKGHEVVVTREPGATAVGKRLRSILLDVSSGGISPRTEALLYAADRAEHIDTVVRPALARGAVVISDRYIDSAVAYQGAGRDLAPTEIARINRWATDGLVAHLTVLLDVSPETARERFTEAPDRLESEPPEFHQRVRAGFLTLAAADPARYLVIDASQDPDAVTRVIRHRLDEVLPLSEQEIEARAEAERKAVEEAARLAAEEAARKAEAERAERERQAQLEKLHREEEERRVAAEEAARQEIAERKAAQEAEVERRRQEEADRLAAEEAARVAAETAAREAEQARLRRLAEEQARLRSEAEARRLEKQRKAEEALLRAEAARAAAADSAGPDEEKRQTDETTVVTPVVPEDEPSSDSSETTTVLPPVVPEREPDSSEGDSSEGGSSEGGSSDNRSSDSGSSERRTSGPDSASDETAVLPAVQAEPASDDETAVLPPVPGTATDADPADRVPPWLFRPESGETERTRELPAVHSPAPKPRPRPDWAEETPLDDLPTLADELLGRHDEDDPRRRP